MDNSPLHYSPPRSLSRVLWPIVVWTVVAIVIMLIDQLFPGSDDPTGEPGTGALLAVLSGLCGLWLVASLLPPRLEAGPEGIAWTRLGVWRRRIAWEEIRRVVTSARPCERDDCPCLTNYLTVATRGEDLDLSEGFVVQEEDVRAMAAVIGDAVERYRPDVEMIDELGWLRRA